MSRAAAHQYGPQIARVAADLHRVARGRLGVARGIDYPAVTAAHWATIAGLTGLAASESTGARRLDGAIRRSYRLGCSTRPVLLAGYSQGAEVVAEAVTALSPAQRRTVTVALFGDPSFEPGLPGDVPRRTPNSGIRPTFLDGDALRLPPAVRRRTLDLCAPGDPICGVPHPSSPTGVAGEVDYVLQHLHVHTTAYGAADARRAAHFLWLHRVPMR